MGAPFKDCNIQIGGWAKFQKGGMKPLYVLSIYTRIGNWRLRPRCSCFLAVILGCDNLFLFLWKGQSKIPVISFTIFNASRSITTLPEIRNKCCIPEKWKQGALLWNRHFGICSVSKTNTHTRIYIHAQTHTHAHCTKNEVFHLLRKSVMENSIFCALCWNWAFSFVLRKF